MQPVDTAARTSQPRNRRTLWLILLVCVAPIVASYLAYYVWRPAGHVNYGELLAPTPLPDVQLTTVSGTPFKVSDLHGQWVLLAAGPATCDDACRRKLLYMRQVRLAQGRESGRIERVWLLPGASVPDAALLAEHAGLVVVTRAEPLITKLPALDAASDHIYVIDPLGNLMMRFPRDVDPKRMLKDVARLLRHSKWK